MLTKSEALKQARKLPLPPVNGEALTITPIEVACAWLELHGLTAARTPLGNPRWVGGVLVLNLTGVEQAR